MSWTWEGTPGIIPSEQYVQRAAFDRIPEVFWGQQKVVSELLNTFSFEKVTFTSTGQVVQTSASI